MDATDHSYHNPLQTINEWWQKRLRGENATIVSISELHNDFVKSAIVPIKAILGIDESQRPLITVRSSFCVAKEYIRPVYSEPNKLGDFFRDPANQKPFTLNEQNAFEGVAKVATTLGRNELRPGDSFAAWHILASGKAEETDGFPKRISDFTDSIRSWHDGALRDEISPVTHCFFSGRKKVVASSPEGLQVAHLVAIYYKAEYSSEGLRDEDLSRLLDHANHLFLGLDLIARIDASLFQSEGLELIGELLPEFARMDVAHADKIAFALERLHRLFTRHMIGRHGGGESQEGANDSRIFYLATAFEKDGTKVTPRLELYPHVYRTSDINHEVSYAVTHRQIATATKLLVHRYLTAPEHDTVATSSGALHAPHEHEVEIVTVSDEYMQLFNDLSDAGYGNWQEAVSPQRDFLLLTKDGNVDLWKLLQKPASANARSLAAFVVEGKAVEGTHASGDGSCDTPTCRRYLPRGVIAIESPYEDGFSDKDVESLRVIFQALASLIRSISHQHAPIDYRPQIVNTFEADVPADRPGVPRPRLTRFLFYTQKMDGDVFKSLVERSEALGISAEAREYLAMISEKVRAGGPEPGPEDRAKILTHRMDGMQQLLEEIRGKGNLADLLSDEVLNFLEACPENFTWASYLRCMAQTLGDRMTPKTMPVFDRLKPGFSASGMFMASVQGELRQVVKLSTAKKVDQEADRYRKWVRYRLINAARIPSGAVAFETTGQGGMESGRADELSIGVTFESVMDTADGILVSDLVSGESSVSGHEAKVSTLLDAVVHCLAASSEDATNRPLPDRSTLNAALRAVFVENAALWADPSLGRLALTEDSDDGLQEIENAFRIVDSATVDAHLQRMSSYSSQLNEVTYGSLKALWNGRELSSNQLKETLRIIHGDLNARNLTWSDALKSFFLIDFEFTGPGLLGCDQMRLIVSLMAEVWFAYGESRPRGFSVDTTARPFVSEIDHAINYLVGVFGQLLIPQGYESLSVAARVNARLSKGTKNKELALIFEAILQTIDPEGKNWTDHSWRAHWALILLVAAIKEFGYTCRNLDEKLVQAVFQEMVIDVEGSKTKLPKATIDSEDLLKSLARRVESVSKSNPGKLNIRYELLRHILTGRLLAKLVAVLSGG